MFRYICKSCESRKRLQNIILQPRCDLYKESRVIVKISYTHESIGFSGSPRNMHLGIQKSGVYKKSVSLSAYC